MSSTAILIRSTISLDPSKQSVGCNNVHDHLLETPPGVRGQRMICTLCSHEYATAEPCATSDIIIFAERFDTDMTTIQPNPPPEHDMRHPLFAFLCPVTLCSHTPRNDLDYLLRQPHTQQQPNLGNTLPHGQNNLLQLRILQPQIRIRLFVQTRLPSRTSIANGQPSQSWQVAD